MRGGRLEPGEGSGSNGDMQAETRRSVTRHEFAQTITLTQGSPGVLERPEVETDTRTSPDRLWNVIVWNDPINLMSYVTFVLQKLFGYSSEKATRLMLEVHRQGRSIVASAEREKAEYYVGRLHEYGLQATLEKPDE